MQVDDRRLIDLYGFFGSNPVGFNHPHFERPEVKARSPARRANQDRELGHLFRRLRGICAKRSRASPACRRSNAIFFIEGGALAVENTLKAAMDWKVRKNIAAGRGRTRHRDSAFPPGVSRPQRLHDEPDEYRPAQDGFVRQVRLAARFQSEHRFFAAGSRADETDVIEREKKSEQEIMKFIAERGIDIAAIIIEPIQGEGGDNHFRGEWLRTLRRICDENEMLLIFDEVQCGMGTTGRNWCCEHFGVKPDLMAFGKKVQVCGVMAGPRLDEVPDNAFRLPSRLNSTWGGNFTDMVRSTHYLRIIEEENLVENAGKVGAYFLKSAPANCNARSRSMTAVRGRGLFLAFDLPDPETRDEFWKGLFDRGVLVLKSGERAIRFRPALDISGRSRRRSDGPAAQAMPKRCGNSSARDVSTALADVRRASAITNIVRGAPIHLCKQFSNNLVSADENDGVFSANGAAAARRSTRFRRSMGRNWPAFGLRPDDDYEAAISRAQEAFLKWRTTPGPVRGETVRRLGNALRESKHDLGQLVTLETGKIIAEGEGEVQEMIDICDFAVGQSRMLYGLTIQSERPSHRLMEQWHPLGVVAVITAFNFPVAVWSWNAALAAVCGDATVWKASEKTPLTAIAVTKIAERVCRETGADPAIFTLLMGDRKTVGQKLRLMTRDSVDLRHGLDANGCARRANGPRPARARRSWNWAETTRSSSRPAPISTWRRNRSFSARSAPPASAAPRPGA